jgi:hypothetical protein
MLKLHAGLTPAMPRPASPLFTSLAAIVTLDADERARGGG